MLHRLDTLISEDFPEYEVDIVRPRTDDWSDFQDACVAGNQMEGMLNLLIARGTIHRLGADGARIVGATVPRIGDLVDEWSTLPELACGTAGLLAGVFADGVNARRLDLAAILGAAERVEAYRVATQDGKDTEAVAALPPVPVEDIGLASLASRSASYGLTADLMRVTIASHPRRGSYVAFLVDDIGAFVFERPRFAAWAAFDRRQRRERFAAGVDLVNACTAFPERGLVTTVIADLPGFVTSAADEIRQLRADVRADVKKGSALSDKPAATPSLPPQL